MYCSDAALIFWTQAVLEEKQSAALTHLPQGHWKPQSSTLVSESFLTLDLA